MAAAKFSTAVESVADAGTTWNYQFSTETPVNLLDTTGGATGWSVIRGGDSFAGTNNQGVASVGTGDAAWVDSAAVSSSSRYMEAGLATFTFSGLDDQKQYDIEVYGSRSGTGDARETEISLDNFSTVEDSADFYNDNNSRTAKALGVSPTDGEITIYLRRAASSQFLYVNAVQIEEAVDSATDIELDGVESTVSAVATPGTLTATSPAIRVDDVLQDTDTGELIDIESTELVILGGTAGSRTIAANPTSVEVVDGVVEIPGAYTIDDDYLVAIVEDSDRMSILPATVIDRNAD